MSIAALRDVGSKEFKPRSEAGEKAVRPDATRLSRRREKRAGATNGRRALTRCRALVS